MVSTRKNPKAPAKRTKMFQVRMSEVEMAAIEKKAAAAHLPAGTWARMVLLATATTLLLGAVPARAFDRWTWQDTAWEAGSIAVMALDWGTTLDGVRRTERARDCGMCRSTYSEGNPLLGRHPSAQKVHMMIGSAIITHAAVSAVLPSKWRRAWQVSTIGLELVVVNGNFQAGLSVRF